jgi:hypothetical protein
MLGISDVIGEKISMTGRTVKKAVITDETKRADCHPQRDNAKKPTQGGGPQYLLSPYASRPPQKFGEKKSRSNKKKLYVN